MRPFLQLSWNSYQPCAKQCQTTKVLLLSIYFLINYEIWQNSTFFTSQTLSSVETVVDKTKYKVLGFFKYFSLFLCTFCPFQNKDEKFSHKTEKCLVIFYCLLMNKTRGLHSFQHSHKRLSVQSLVIYKTQASCIVQVFFQIH